MKHADCWPQVREVHSRHTCAFDLIRVFGRLAPTHEREALSPRIEHAELDRSSSIRVFLSNTRCTILKGLASSVPWTSCPSVSVDALSKSASLIAVHGERLIKGQRSNSTPVTLISLSASSLSYIEPPLKARQYHASYV